MDRGAWRATDHGVTVKQTERLSTQLGKRGKAERKSRDNRTAMGQGPGFCSRNIHNNPSAGSEASVQMEGGNLRLSTRFLEYCPVTTPPNNQKKVIHTAALTPNFAYKNFFPKPLESYGFLSRSHPFSLLDSTVNPFLFQHFHLFGLTVCWAGELVFGYNIFAGGTSFSLLLC